MAAMTAMLASAADLFAFGSRANLILIGAVLLIVGFLIRQRASRYSLTDMAIDAAWQTAKARGHTQTELENKVREIASEQSNARRAKLVAGHAARHALSQVLGTVGAVIIVLGLLVLVASYFRH
jgi:hypothetical protein